jgi:hypothetical protein
MKIAGLIVRRRSMGKNLAFAQIEVLSTANSDDDNNDNNSLFMVHAIENSTMDSMDKKTFDTEEQGNTNTSSIPIIKVAFVRQSPVWTNATNHTTTTTPFPTKASALPYGALIEVDLGIQSLITSNATHHHPALPSPLLQGEEKLGPLGHSSSCCISHVDTAASTAALEVCKWKILSYPRDAALSSAKDTATGGISISLYLQERGNMYRRMNTTHPQGGRTEQSSTKEPCQPPPTPQESTVNSIGKLENANLPSSVLSSLHPHGDSRAKALRAKIFASWIIETMFPTRVYHRPDPAMIHQSSCMECNQNVDQETTITTTTINVLDIAGGKGTLSVN